MLVFLVSAWLLATADAFPRLPRANSTVCKTTPKDSNWPAEDVWDSLNATVDGRLLQPSPPGAVCHTSQPTFASTECATVQKQWEDEYFHSENPVSVEWNNWTNDTCPPDPRMACSAAGYPIYVVNATTPEHVKAGVDFGKHSSPGTSQH